ncbi:MAG TPA: NAD-dependent epimerase/dehydratase family protein, partial [Actinomycetota bacterium]|nr:NAD-dependent epimerase/dehydratase family protein [Actinomycetota bacterium]
LAGRGVPVTNLDKGTYAADARRLEGTGDLVETRAVDVAADPLGEHLAGASAVVHLAAETHVTRSEVDRDTFFRANVDGTRSVLAAADAAGVDTVVHFSTDEVYGPALETPFAERDKAPGEGRATSAYARSKAFADDLAVTFRGAPRVYVVRPTNCFGPFQHPEKAIARWTVRALSGRDLPVWGDGRYVRDWMVVDDVCDAVDVLLRDRPPPGAYNVGPGGEPVPNLVIAREIARLAGRGDDAVYLTAYDRPAHDRRYSVDSSKMRALGWAPATGLSEGLRATVEWYREHREWWEPLVGEAESLYVDGTPR